MKNRGKDKCIITGGYGRIGLAICRSLGRAGIDVTVGSDSWIATTFFSKYCSNRFVYTSPMKNRFKFVSELMDKVKSKKYSCMMPLVGESTIEPISSNREAFSKYTALPIVDYKTLQIATDKLETYRALKNIVPCPRTYESLDKVKNFPVLIKPRRSTEWSEKGGVRPVITESNIAENEDELVKKYEVFKRRFKPIIQELVRGESKGFFALFNQGKPKAIFMHKRIRQYPPNTGQSTYRVSVYDKKIKKYGLKVLKKLKWHGVAMVEFKGDYVLEINGRFWGSLPLAIASGVNFPYLLYKLAVNGDVEEVMDYKVGVGCKYEMGEFLHWLSSDNKIPLLKKMLSERSHWDVMSIYDPLPMLGRCLVAVKDMMDVIRGKRKISGEYL